MVQKRLIDYSSNLKPLDIAEISIDSPKYPTMLRQIKDPSKTLYVLGNVELLNCQQLLSWAQESPVILAKNMPSEPPSSMHNKDLLLFLVLHWESIRL